LLDNIARLIRVERGFPLAHEIAPVLEDLERALGPTVTRALAARALGVSQTALDRWIGQGDVPVVLAANGNREVPVRALLDLVETVESRRRGGDRHPLASVLRARRSAADSLDPEKVLPARYRGRKPEGGHRGAELRSLAFHRTVAERLDDELVHEARRRVRRWRLEGRIHPRWANGWEDVLLRPLPQIAKLISRDTQEARDLRQSSPFAGALSEAERRRVLEIAS